MFMFIPIRLASGSVKVVWHIWCRMQIHSVQSSITAYNASESTFGLSPASVRFIYIHIYISTYIYVDMASNKQRTITVSAIAIAAVVAVFAVTPFVVAHEAQAYGGWGHRGFFGRGFGFGGFGYPGWGWGGGCGCGGPWW
jgi:hypothetical protein